MATRAWLVGMAVAAAYICLIDRVAISVAIIPMVEEYGWSPTQQGAVMSAFFLGYVALQLPAGWVSDRFGGKWVLGLGVLCWSLFTALTPAAAALGLTALVACRLLMGMGESVTFPAIYSLFASWLAPGQRGLALGLLNSSISGGTIIALLATPWLIEASGWRYVFYVYGALGVIWGVLWFPLVPATTARGFSAGGSPADASPVSGAQSDYLPFTWRSTVRLPAIWALAYAHFATNWVVFLALAWLPTYLSRAFGLGMAEIGAVAVVPYLVSTLATPLYGKLTDAALARGVNRTRWRKALQGFAMGGAGLVTAIVGYVDSLPLAVGLFCLANACVAASVGGFAANHHDIAPDHSGTLFGATNAIASFGSAGSVFVAGLVLEWTGSWSAVFQSAALVAASGGVVYIIYGSTERRF